MKAIHPPEATGPGSARFPVKLVSLETVLGLFAFAALTYGDLPERLPIHFDAAGEPNGWATRSVATWLTLPLTALGMLGLMALGGPLVAATRRRPRWLNLPHKERFLALPAERQEPVWSWIRDMMWWLLLPMLGICWTAQVGIWRMATGAMLRLPLWPIWAWLLLEVGLTVWCVVRLVRLVRRAVDV